MYEKIRELNYNKWPNLEQYRVNVTFNNEKDAIDLITELMNKKVQTIKE